MHLKVIPKSAGRSNNLGLAFGTLIGGTTWYLDTASSADKETSHNESVIVSLDPELKNSIDSPAQKLAELEFKKSGGSILDAVVIRALADPMLVKKAERLRDPELSGVFTNLFRYVHGYIDGSDITSSVYKDFKKKVQRQLRDNNGCCKFTNSAQLVGSFLENYSEIDKMVFERNWTCDSCGQLNHNTKESWTVGLKHRSGFVSLDDLLYDKMGHEDVNPKKCHACLHVSNSGTPAQNWQLLNSPKYINLEVFSEAGMKSGLMHIPWALKPSNLVKNTTYELNHIIYEHNGKHRTILERNGRTWKLKKGKAIEINSVLNTIKDSKHTIVVYQKNELGSVQEALNLFSPLPSSASASQAQNDNESVNSSGQSSDVHLITL